MARMLLLFTFIAIVRSQLVPERCSVCQAVSAELYSRIKSERPRNHLDLRHRLDKDGKRYGKLVEWK